MNTKENILLTSLQLFAKDGYEAVSVSDIAGALGFSKGALYKHYKNKRDIFDSIVMRMQEYDYENAHKFELPENIFEEMPAEYKSTPIEMLSAYTLAQFLFWTEDKFASNFRKMLSIERWRNAEMEEMYQRFLGSGPMKHVADIFLENVNGNISELEAEILAMEFYAPVYTLIDIYDGYDDKRKIGAMLKEHMESFIDKLLNHN